MGEILTRSSGGEEYIGTAELEQVAILNFCNDTKNNLVFSGVKGSLSIKYVPTASLEAL